MTIISTKTPLKALQQQNGKRKYTSKRRRDQKMGESFYCTVPECYRRFSKHGNMIQHCRTYHHRLSPPSNNTNNKLIQKKKKNKRNSNSDKKEEHIAMLMNELYLLSDASIISSDEEEDEGKKEYYYSTPTSYLTIDEFEAIEGLISLARQK